MDKELDAWSAILARMSAGASLTPLETNNLRDVLRRSRAEIERLEGDVIQERGHRAAQRQEYDAITRALRQQLDAYTDRMIAAGLMS
jgi:hypothetical protein